MGELLLTHHGHSKTICIRCGVIMKQCRCDGDKAAFYDTCEKCKRNYTTLPGGGKVAIILTPACVDSCFYAEIKTYGRPIHRRGVVAYERWLSVFSKRLEDDRPQTEKDDDAKLETDIRAIGEQPFAQSWEFLVRMYDAKPQQMMEVLTNAIEKKG